MAGDKRPFTYWDEAVEVALAVLETGLITKEQLRKCLDIRRKSRPPIGKLAVLSRTLSMGQVFRILEHQADSSKPFGRVAIDLGFMNETQLGNLLHNQADSTAPLTEVLVTEDLITRTQADLILKRINDHVRAQYEQLRATALT